MSALLAIDVGTTHIKAGIFDSDSGDLLRLALRPMPLRTSPAGWRCYDPDKVWDTAQGLIQEVAASAESVSAVGVTSMAETGVLIDRQTRQPRSPLLPWFDPAASAQAARLQSLEDPFTQFQRSGLRPGFKAPLARLLWLRDEQSTPLDGALWLSAADYVVFRLTGQFGTDYSLAGRTLAFDIRARVWDESWLGRLGLNGCFPDARPAGSVFGEVNCPAIGLPAGIPVTVAGHDHICAAYGVGAVESGMALDSMGTAEALVGALDTLELDQAAYDSGLSFGCHTYPGRFYWIGANSASGGSVEWLRSLLADPPLTYEQVAGLLDSIPPQPTGILYAPYLSGAGIPRPDASVGAAFIGLRWEHSRAHLIRAALEGTAYEMEMIRELAETSLGQPFTDCTVVGGSTRNPHWMQIKADVSGLRLRLCQQPEAALFGAARLAYHCAGSRSRPIQPPHREIIPDAGRHQLYRQLYLNGYQPLQSFLRKVSL